MKKAFTLLELLLVIAIVASLAGLIINALNPAERLNDANEAKLVTTANDVEKAINSYALDNNGSLPTSILALSSYGLYDICNEGELTDCVNLDDLVPDYLGTIPQDTQNSTDTITGFKAEYDPTKKEVMVYSNREYEERVESGATITKGMVGYWKLDEASWSGTPDEVVDSSLSLNHGVRNANANITAGKFDNGGSFDGTSDWVKFNNAIDLGTKHSVSFWINYQDSGDAVIIGNAASKYAAYVDSSGSGGSIYYNPDPGTGPVSEVHGGLTSGTWYHFTITRDEREVDFYKNGVQIGTTQVLNATNLPLSIQCLAAHCNEMSALFEFQGGLDEVRIYNRVLTSEEASAVYNYGPPPIAHWKFDEGSGSTTADSSGSNNTGNLTNGPTWVDGRYGKALDFVATTLTNGDHVRFSPVNLAATTGAELTFNAWVKPDSIQTNSSAFLTRNGPGNDANYAIFLTSPLGGYRIISFHYYDGTTYRTISTSNRVVKDADWNYISIVMRQGINVTFYVDGSFVQTVSWSGTNSVLSTSRMELGGATGANGQTFDGIMDEIKIYNYARTPVQIVRDMENI